MKILLNDGWQFTKLPEGSTREEALHTAWKPVDLPHDWLIWQADDLYETADAWYRRILRFREGDAPVTMIRFDGVYMDCDVLLNGEVICSHPYGYTAFDAELTGKLREGDNELMVHIRHKSPNSRWYSGSGIYRDVSLLRLPETFLVPDGLTVVTRRADIGAYTGKRPVWRLEIRAEVRGEGTAPFRCKLWNARGMLISEVGGDVTDGLARASFSLPTVEEWSVEKPTLYTLEYTLGSQKETCRIGFRETRFDPDHGFFLNGRPLKLHGVCLHHDLGALGAAFHPKAARRQLRLMKEMGANAVRTSHNPPASAFLDLCDEMGILVVDEAFDMWERSKTEYDYARFFPDHAAEDVASWVRRDRCHPCVIMWSIGNEIFDMQADDRGREVTAMLRDQVLRHDPEGHARVTFGSNYMPWEGAQRCAELVRIPGYNYAEKYYWEHHRKHPDWVIYGSETASVLSSRGIYHFPKNRTIMAEADLQCSALGNSNTSWGATDLCSMIVDDLNTPYSMGQFIWSGIDYIGEPTPYHTRSCYFGQADTACFPKDAYYLFKSLWTQEPMIHIGVSWDWNPGQMIDVPVMTNCAEAELLLNGHSLGRQSLDPRDPGRCQALWQLPFEAGTLCARAYDAEGNLQCVDYRHTSGETARLLLSSENWALRADGTDLAFVTVEATDDQGRKVENARDRVKVSVSGGGRLLGLDNGDSTDREGYKTATRRLFGGKLLIIIGSTGESENVLVRVAVPDGPEAELTISVIPADRISGLSCLERIPDAPVLREKTVRKIELEALETTELTPEHPSCLFRWRLLPEDASFRKVEWEVTNDAGIVAPCADWVETPEGIRVTAHGDGDFRLRALGGNAEDHPEIISQLEIHASGFGQAALDPYSFVSAGLFDLQAGDIGAGNEKGISFARDGESMIGFSHVDFGKAGSDRMTMPIFALNGEAYEMDMYLGDPAQGGRLLTTLHYQKPSLWNVYQEESWTLPSRLTGVQTLCFVMKEKVHLKGFVFEKQSRADQWLTAGGADEMYGDTFRRDGEAVRDIGNNVTLTYRDMDFGNRGEAVLTLEGSTPLEAHPITVRMTDEKGDSMTEIVSFQGSGPKRQAFSVRVPQGLSTVSFVFLPGSRFDFEGFTFGKR